MAHTGPTPIDVLPGIPAIARGPAGLRDLGMERRLRPGRHRRRAHQQLNDGDERGHPRSGGGGQRLAGLGRADRANTIAEFAAFREQQIAFFAEMVKKANIRID